MKRVIALVALLIGLGVVFVAQKGFPKNSSIPGKPNQLPPVNSPPNSLNNVSPNPPSGLPSQPDNLTPSNPAPGAMKDANKAKNVKDAPSTHSSDESKDEDDDSSDETAIDASESERTEQEHHHHEHQDQKPTSTECNDKNVLILIVSYFRSHSSFVGDLMQQPNSTFYTAEPLQSLGFNHKVDSEDEKEALRILQNIFQCSFTKEEKYSDWICSKENRKPVSSLKRNRALWKSCEPDRSWCCDPEFIDGVCSQTNIRIIKENRISLESVDELLSKACNMFVLFLARDPRGIYNARKHLKWCKDTSCIDYEQLCADLTSDLTVYPRLVEKYGKKVSMLRIEDLARAPLIKGRALFERFKLPFTSEIIEYIDAHTNPDIENDSPYSVIKDPRKIIRNWVDQLNQTIVDSIQDSCASVFQQLGYIPVDLSDISSDSDGYDQIIADEYSTINHL